MQTAPQKNTTLKLSPERQQIHQNTKALERKVSNFIEENFSGSLTKAMKQDISDSNPSMKNSSKFITSEINIMRRINEDMAKVWHKVFDEKEGLEKKCKQYMDKVDELKKENTKQKEIIKKHEEEMKKTAARTTTGKESTVKISQFNLHYDESSTKKKPQSQSPSYIPVSTSNSCANLSHPPRSPRNLSVNPSNQQKMSNELTHYKKQAQYWETKCSQQGQQLMINKKLVVQYKDKYKNKNYEFLKLQMDHSKVELQLNMLSVEKKSLERQYNLLEETHGLALAEAEIKLQNLRDVLKGLKLHASPDKKLQEGYYSINKPLNKSESKESLASSQSNLSMGMSHLQTNLKEQNQYLRTQLIQALDEKGRLRVKLLRLEKQLEKLKSQQSKQLAHVDSQNNPNLSNVSNQQQMMFKKKNESILVVQTSKSQGKMIKLLQEKLQMFLKLAYRYIGESSPKQISIKLDLSKGKILQEFDILLEKLIKFSMEKRFNSEQLHSKQIKIKSLEQKLNKQKAKYETLASEKTLQDDKIKKLEEESKLKSISKNDSTDEAFRNIIITKEKKKSQLTSLEQSCINYMEYFKRKSQRLEAKVEELQERIAELEVMQESFYRLTNKSQSSNLANSTGKTINQVPLTTSMALTPVNHYEQQSSYFEFFKQKLTEFYQHTIKQLDNLEGEKGKCVQSKKQTLPMIKNNNEMLQNHSYKIPQVVEKNILKVSREFKSIQSGSFEEISENNSSYLVNNSFFKDQKLSQSFIAEQKIYLEQKNRIPDISIEQMIKNRLQEFQKFSNAWIKQALKQSSCDQQKLQDITIKHEPKLSNTNEAKTERIVIEKPVSEDLDQIDAKSEYVSEQELIKERQLFIREEVSYYLKSSEKMKDLIRSNLSDKKSWKSEIV